MPSHSKTKTSRLSVWGDGLLNKLSSLSRKRRKREASKKRRVELAAELYPCPCCAQKTLTEPPPGTFEICVVCGWEDDEVQYRDPNYEGGANEMSLIEARASYEAKSR